MEMILNECSLIIRGDTFGKIATQEKSGKDWEIVKPDVFLAQIIRIDSEGNSRTINLEQSEIRAISKWYNEVQCRPTYKDETFYY